MSLMKLLLGFAFGALLGAIFLVGFSIGIAHSHEAPSGWTYEASCCSGQDCRHIHDAAVRQTPAGYEVTLTPAEHPQLANARTWTVPYSDRRVRPSPDGEYHACVTKEAPLTHGGTVIGGHLICLYVPPAAF